MKSDFGIVGNSEFNFGSLGNAFCRCVLEYRADVTVTLTQDPADPKTGEMPPPKISCRGGAIKTWKCVSEHLSNYFKISPDTGGTAHGVGGGQMRVTWFTYVRCTGCGKKRQEGKELERACTEQGEICYDTLDRYDMTILNICKDMWYKSKGGKIRADTTRAIMKKLVSHAFDKGKCPRTLNCKKMSGCPKDEK